MRWPLAVLFAWTVTACASRPCGWDTIDLDRTAAEGVSLTCGTSSHPVVARYESAVSPASGADSILTLRFIAVGHALTVSVNFPANFPDGTYSVPLDRAIAWVEPDANGSFSFSRTHDVPFADIPAPEAGTYSSAIEFELDLQLVGEGCRLRTEARRRLVQSGPTLDCSRSSLSFGH